jgi:hypothetical protein
MRKSAIKLLAILFVAAVPMAGQAATVSVVEGGTTSVLFGNGALDALGLGIKGVDGTIVPGNLGPFSVAFGITGRDVETLPTTFSYDAGDFLGTFAGSIEHSGTIELTDAATGTASITVGNFTIGFDAGRSDETRSGFFVQDNVDTGAVLFDIGNPIVEAFDTSLVIAADILVSQELSDTLNALELIDFDATGVDGGMALVIANGSVVPVPAAVWLFASALGLLGWVRRRV